MADLCSVLLVFYRLNRLLSSSRFRLVLIDVVRVQ